MLTSEKIGLLKIATIVGVDSATGTAEIRFDFSESPNLKQTTQPTKIRIPYNLASNNGLFIGSQPQIGTSIIVGQGSSNQYFFVSYFPNNKDILPSLDQDKILISSNENTQISLTTNNNIKLGSPLTNISANTNPNYNFLNTNFDSIYSFTQGTRNINGVVKRDSNPNYNFSQSSKLESDSYEPFLITIGFDPTVKTNSKTTGNIKNPPFVESRHVIYEFAQNSDVKDDFFEASLYGKTQQQPTKYTLPNRRISKSDTLSLSLVAPNYLIERVEGTVVDIFGNLLDINRKIIKFGDNNLTLKSDQTNNVDKSQTYKNIRDLHRKTIAYHFELNARKDLKGLNALSNINSNADNSKSRSRLFVDIDKEGQLKINIPASSEIGNIPLLTRYENYSTFGTEDNGNPNKLFFNNDLIDVYQDSFASIVSPRKESSDKSRGSIIIKDGDKEATPIDRITKSNIRHGTAHHDITDSCYLHQTTDLINYQVPGQQIFDLSTIDVLTTPVTKTIYTSGANANAGGRSGQINFDGSIEMNIGANTSDRQSLWADLAGGMVANIGRDLRKNSALVGMDGNFLLQVGGFGISGDSRFVKENNGLMGAVLDIRVFNDGNYCHMIRCDKNGITIMTPGQLKLFSKGNMFIETTSSLYMNADMMYLQNRLVSKFPPTSI